MSHQGVQEVIDALTRSALLHGVAQPVNPALQEVLYCIIAGQDEGFTEAGFIAVPNPSTAILELGDTTRWTITATLIPEVNAMSTCQRCRSPISSVDAKKQIEVHANPDGSTTSYGINQPAGLLNKATGKIKAIYHYKCWMAYQRTLRANTDDRGRYYSSSPSAYAQSASHQNRDDVTPEATARAQRADAELLAMASAARPTQSFGDLNEDLKQHEAELLKARQAEIDAQRALEPTPNTDESDWRDPMSMDL